MLRDDPIEWARLCREQAALTPDPKIAGLLVQLADQCDALAERINSPGLNGFGASNPDCDETAS
jgi:hypothetical protein